MVAMRRWAAVLVAASMALTACAGSRGRTFEQYYDPKGLFTAYLPAGNDITVASPQPSATGPSLVAGVVSAPPRPSPAPQQGGFGNFIQQTAPADQTVYEMFVVTTDSFSSIGDMVLFFLTSDPSIDVKHEEDVSVGGNPGRLVVADITDGNRATAGIAAAFTLGVDGTGYLVAAVFPPGDWDRERSDFGKVVGSFKTEVPPGITSIPVSGGSA